VERQSGYVESLLRLLSLVSGIFAAFSIAIYLRTIAISFWGAHINEFDPYIQYAAKIPETSDNNLSNDSTYPLCRSTYKI